MYLSDWAILNYRHLPKLTVSPMNPVVGLESLVANGWVVKKDGGYEITDAAITFYQSCGVLRGRFNQ